MAMEPVFVWPKRALGIDRLFLCGPYFVLAYALPGWGGCPRSANGVHPGSFVWIGVLNGLTVTCPDSMLLVPIVFSLANLCVNVAIWARGDLGPTVQGGLFEPNETEWCQDRTAMLFTVWAGLLLVHVCLWANANSSKWEPLHYSPIVGTRSSE